MEEQSKGIPILYLLLLTETEGLAKNVNYLSAFESLSFRLNIKHPGKIYRKETESGDVK
jgi:hypothetical protein